MQRDQDECHSFVPAPGAVFVMIALIVGPIPCFGQTITPAHTPTSNSLTTSTVQTAKESNIKAVYLYSFGRFTTWPTSDSNAVDQFTIGVVGPTGVHSSLEKIAAKRTIQEMPIQIRHYVSASEVTAGDCQLLFVTQSIPAADAATLAARLRETPVLIATETGDCPVGTVVNFVPEGSSIHFEIDIEEAKRKRLAMDARLLRQGKPMPSSTPNQGP
ncbi:hypothetical protein K227x_57580 [Rubripirellula lacrimiformis]|uniref:YfiR family protein n=1 Tax=Rubripirellula lacrimiformis TaxID=1930273 RepID=A0A517NJM3_9BACT|nr:YfiR family protein [Rubripirellula lacrimiformis]QDT07331.1 hypothetical protein K227x_57580 [Rubripirellula lacrimiformis]